MTQRRFIRRGVSKILFHPGVADRDNVTRSELDAAFDLTPFIREVNGWGLENNAVATPDLGSKFESSIPGTDSANDSSLGFYEDLDTEEIEALLPKDSEGDVIIMRKGDKPGSASMDVFPTRVATRNTEISMGNDPAGFSARFNITAAPSQDRVIPAITASAPVLTSVSPSTGVVANDQLILTGVGLSSVTAVAMTGGAAIPASDWAKIGDTKIALVSPTRTAGGTYAITVTDADGTSNAVNVTYA